MRHANYANSVGASECSDEQAQQLAAQQQQQQLQRQQATGSLEDGHENPPDGRRGSLVRTSQFVVCVLSSRDYLLLLLETQQPQLILKVDAKYQLTCKIEYSENSQ